VAIATLLSIVVIIFHLACVQYFVLLSVGGVAEDRTEDPYPATRAFHVPHFARHFSVGLYAAAGLAAPTGVTAARTAGEDE